MSNFLQETISAMNSNDLTEADVKWVGSSDGKYAITWQAFIAIANIDYDSGYGGQEIASDIVIVGDDW